MQLNWMRNKLAIKARAGICISEKERMSSSPPSGADMPRVFLSIWYMQLLGGQYWQITEAAIVSEPDFLNSNLLLLTPRHSSLVTWLQYRLFLRVNDYTFSPLWNDTFIYVSHWYHTFAGKITGSACKTYLQAGNKKTVSTESFGIVVACSVKKAPSVRT